MKSLFIRFIVSPEPPDIEYSESDFITGEKTVSAIESLEGEICGGVVE